MNFLQRLFPSFLLSIFLSTAFSVSASEGGGGGGNELIARVEPITVNLMGPSQQYIQVEMSLKLAKPEVAEKVKLFMPVIRHKMILLLTSKEASQLGPIEGKQKLVQEAKEAINQALELSEKDGVTDVLFNSLIIQ
jgi:flagellar FliL protein